MRNIFVQCYPFLSACALAFRPLITAQKNVHYSFVIGNKQFVQESPYCASVLGKRKRKNNVE